jgi:hypothetical protein
MAFSIHFHVPPASASDCFPLFGGLGLDEDSVDAPEFNDLFTELGRCRTMLRIMRSSQDTSPT